MSTLETTDVFIAGAGPVGLTLAMASTGPIWAIGTLGFSTGSTLNVSGNATASNSNRINLGITGTISGGGITGTVREIGLFATTIDQPDNVRTTIGNNKLFADNIVNFSANSARRVDLTAQLAHSVEPQQAMTLIRARIAQIPNVLPEPAPDVEILEFNAAGTKLVVRPYCHNDHYWQVYFDTNKALAEVGGANNWPIPAPHQVLRQPS